ncbi:uncharacterized protein LDX57_009138 [Aspergillus melleus]|uniref:uncharacterized protein n=1 Tax=Aspergillus melleus TaxID=138277 RepID=UPI001E8D9B0D|nr:uncharacterized protein LDX57_009138 [Aspergillus melleus]KAH8431475.1 hypothetical protein LDX57_009138 [Aspergillus melleus]
MKVRLENEKRCWACGLEVVDIAHIIAKEDSAFDVLQAKGLINFDVTSTQNAMALCPVCHRLYDDGWDPGFTFWPVDLDFFIRFELRDRARRRRLPPTEQRQRRVPTARQYQFHQKGTDKEGWGMYQRVYLNDSKLSMFIKDEPTKAWSGSPMAALRRAIGAIGSPRSFRFPPNVIEKLRILQDLYYGPEDEEAEVEKKHGLDPFEEPDDDIDLIEEEEEEGEEDEDDEEEEWVPPAKRRTPRRQADAKFDYYNWSWDFGPESSSEDKRKQFSVPELLGPRPL